MVTQCHLPNAASNGGFFCFCELLLSLVLRPSIIAHRPNKREWKTPWRPGLDASWHQRVSSGLVKAY